MQFTGKFRGQYFYKGAVWGGPTNAIGHGAQRATFSRKPRGKCDLRGGNYSPSCDLEVCAREGAFVLFEISPQRFALATRGAEKAAGA